jgi:hypothetical protein
MKKVLLLILAGLANMHFSNAQTKTVTVDANDILNNNTKIVAQTSAGQIFFTGHQLGAGYNYPAGIFRAITDNNNNAANYYYDGITNGNTNFSVRADGQGYFAGNVGIGTNSPYAKFTVYNSVPLGSVAKNNVLLSSVSSTAGTANNFKNNLWIVRNAAGSDWTTARLHDGISVDVSFGNPQTDTRTWWERDPNQDIQSWGTSGSTYLSINAGNVGVGTIDTKGYKFAVNGNVIATSMTVKLYANWPDYVFKKDYTLPALTDVKTYIYENHHLPEIPSEQEVAKNGINLGEMNKLLLKKVEELTLYLIEKDKNEKENTAQLKFMAQELANLKKQVTHLNKKQPK